MQPGPPPYPAGPPPRKDGFGSFVRDFVPTISAFGRLRSRGWLLPGIGFIVALTSLWGAFFLGSLQAFLNLFGFYASLGILFFVYRVCGKRKPLRAFLAVMFVEAVLMVVFVGVFIFFFRGLTGAAHLMSTTGFVTQFLGHFVGAGLMEEFMKMLPVFGLLLVTFKLPAHRRSFWGVTEPLDAILYACASATVFVQIETLGQYVPNMVQEGGLAAGQSLAIVRIFGNVCGHLAYSGYFGYFVGLGVLRPRRRWLYWIGGYVIASLLHGFHNAAGNLVFLAVAWGVSFFLFIGAILNARKLSPTRADNFATGFFTIHKADLRRPPGVPPVPAAARVGAMAGPPPIPGAPVVRPPPIPGAAAMGPPPVPGAAAMGPPPGPIGPPPPAPQGTGGHRPPGGIEGGGHLFLRAVAGPMAGEEFDLSREQLVLGRDPTSAQINLQRPEVSRRHCQVRLGNEAGTVELEDCGSTHGTFLDDGTRLVPWQTHRLRAPQRFRLGHEIVFEVGTAAVTQTAILRGVSGPFAGQTFPVDEEPLVLGRDPQQAKLVFDPMATEISRRHCSVRWDAPRRRFVVEDHGSTQGSFLAGGERLEAGRPYELEPGQRLVVGTPRFTFEVVVTDAPQS